MPQQPHSSRSTETEETTHLFTTSTNKQHIKLRKITIIPKGRMRKDMNIKIIHYNHVKGNVTYTV